MGIPQRQRIYNEVVSIEYDATRQFFEERGRKAASVGMLNATMYQDQNPELAFARDNFEKKAVLDLILLQPFFKVLDIGCGAGRWGFFLADHIDRYLGIDFSAALINVAVAEKANCPSAHKLSFQNISATEILNHPLLVPPPFHFFIISGLMTYLNDADCAALLSQISLLSARPSMVYVREPSAVDCRLTLNRYFSEELHTEYSAIYRTDAEYQKIFQTTLGNEGFVLQTAQNLFPENLCNRKETNQRIYIFNKLS